MNTDRVLLVLRLLSGGVFVVFGIGKFVNHAAPEAFMIVIGGDERLA
ncbi:MAG: hypothetical protein JO363_06885 [Solirubrobacterales bacterium]|nr:hypothetical protein [Solirubrobacterales bacterium]